MRKKLALIVRMDDTGLGNQTRELYEMLKPHKLMVINSSSFKENIKQHPEWYEKHNNAYVVNGFPSVAQIMKFLTPDIDVILSVELFYNFDLVHIAKIRGIKTILQYNYEFFDYLDGEHFKPDLFIAPAEWNIDKLKDKGIENIKFLPPPINDEKFENIRIFNKNIDGELKILHMLGIRAVNDRNGTKDLEDSLKYSKGKYKLTIHSQNEYDGKKIKDERVEYRSDNFKDIVDIYKGFDLIVIPRKYGGLCLPMNEAMMAGIIPIMTDIEPNSSALPGECLVESKKYGEFEAHMPVDLYQVNKKELAKTLDKFAKMTRKELNELKSVMASLAYNRYSSDILHNKYKRVIEEI